MIGLCPAARARSPVDEELASLGTVQGGFNRESFNHLDSSPLFLPRDLLPSIRPRPHWGRYDDRRCPKCLETRENKLDSASYFFGPKLHDQVGLMRHDIGLLYLPS